MAVVAFNILLLSMYSKILSKTLLRAYMCLLYLRIWPAKKSYVPPILCMVASLIIHPFYSSDIVPPISNFGGFFYGFSFVTSGRSYSSSSDFYSFFGSSSSPSPYSMPA
jgi:hypothetical protein